MAWDGPTEVGRGVNCNGHRFQQQSMGINTCTSERKAGKQSEETGEGGTFVLSPTHRWTHSEGVMPEIEQIDIVL
eukprot:459241-Prorocentrum_lima.AAC.1